MGADWARRLTAMIGLVAMPLAASAAAPSADEPPPARARERARAGEKPAGMLAGEPAELQKLRAEAEKARVDAERRLKPAADGTDKGPKLPGKALKEILEERLQLLKAWDEAVKARRESEQPEQSPERQAAEAKADLEHLKALMEQSAKNPDVLLPSSLRVPKNAGAEAVMAEIKEAIDEGQSDLKEWAEKLEKLKAEAPQAAAPRLLALRTERDKAHQRLATVKARQAERDLAVANAQTAAERNLALERLTNFQWEIRVEQERLCGCEAQTGLHARLSSLAALQLEQTETHVVVARKTLEVLQARYQTVADRREVALKNAAAVQEHRAAELNDPLERYRAARQAVMFETERQITEYKKTYGTSPYPALEDMKKFADAAETDFANIKKLLDDGSVSHLDALRLNNDFRRIGPERERIVRRELAAVTNQMTTHENALSGVELALVTDLRDDRLEFEALLERLPMSRHAEAEAVYNEMEDKQVKLLKELQQVLVDLASRSEQTHEQILRRIKILDEQYGFIRTHLILVRDREPIGKVTFLQAQRELGHVASGLVRLVLEVKESKLWGRVSVEFGVALSGVLILPWPLVRMRRALANEHCKRGRAA